MSETLPTDLRAIAPIAGAIIVSVAMIGFLAGTAPSDYDWTLPVSSKEAAVHEVPRALSYAELRHAPRGAGVSNLEREFAAMRGPSPLDPVSPSSAKPTALAERARNRSYDGAPPRIPHPVRQDSASECLVCHDEGLRFRGRLAPPMSHRELTSCTQCHVVDQPPMPGGQELPPDPRDIESRFVGLASPAAGPRASSIAPPQIPHRTAMRERCGSCHGVNGRDPIRSSHPYRQSCEQCHTASAEIDLRPGRAELGR